MKADIIDILLDIIYMYDTYLDSKPSKISLGDKQMEEFENSEDKDILEVKYNDIEITKSYTKDGIYVYSSKREHAPYALILDKVISFRLKKGTYPDEITLSEGFISIYGTDDRFYENQILFDCRVKIDHNTYESIVCKLEDSECMDYEEDEEEPLTEKDIFIDWLLEDDRSLKDAKRFVEENNDTIDKDFVTFQRWSDYLKYLEDNNLGTDEQ